MTSSPSLAESTTLPSFDRLLASLSQPELRQSSAPLGPSETRAIPYFEYTNSPLFETYHPARH